MITDGEIRSRFVDIEMTLDEHQKALDDLSDMVVRQGKLIDTLFKQNQMLRNMLEQDVVKPLEEETPPPHY